MEKISGYLVSVMFHNESNNYCVAKIKLDDGSEDKVILVGYFPIAKKDDLVIYTGEFITHPKYGKQFKVESYEKVLPTGEEAIIRYLSSSYFLGIGKEKATKIVKSLDSDCINKIIENPFVLDGILNEKDKKIIINGLNVNDNLEQALSIFVGAGISMKNIMKMEAIYKEEMISKVLNDPYILIEDIEGIGFNSADKIASSLGVQEDDPRRIRAAMFHALNMLNMETGNTYIDIESLYHRTVKIIPALNLEQFEEGYKYLINEMKIISEDDRIYSYTLNHAEKRIASFLTPFIKRQMKENDLIDDYIKQVEDREGIKYSENQIEAIKSCLCSGISIVTGGPGTGKTTILNAIIKIYKLLYPENIIVLTAPTGKASKRISELTGENAVTIHRLLKWDLHSNYFAKNENDPVIGDLLVIDESSMVDTFLFSKLLEACNNFNQVIIIGDSDQLPSVGPGCVLNDLIDTQLIPVNKLNKIYRQTESSSIVTLAHHIKDKKIYKEDLDTSSDLEFIDATYKEVADLVVNEIRKAMEKGYSLDDIAVLAPIYSGIGGIDHLNEAIREVFNPRTSDKKEYQLSKRVFRIGDKILQLKNQPDDDIYNGDVGRLVEIFDKDHPFKSNYIVVDYDGNLVEYAPTDLINIRHAYAISVHKSQGSEYPYVIMPIIYQYSSMLSKNLVYTGISRAKKKLVLIGEKRTFINAIKNRELKRRKTTLIEKIKELS